MEKFQTEISKKLNETSLINWSIVIELSKIEILKENLDFSFVNNEVNEREPFNFNLGYISLDENNNPGILNNFDKILKDLVKKYAANDIALCNLFIITTRLSYSGDNQEYLLEQFVKELSIQKRAKLFELLIQDMNKKYYAHKQVSVKTPKNITEWLDLFNQAQYLQGFNDVTGDVIHLVKDYTKPIKFEYLQQLSPLLRSTIYFDFELNAKELSTLINTESDEITYIVASLLEKSEISEEPPVWLNKELIDYIFKNKSEVAQQTIYYLFGFIRYESKRKTLVYEHFRLLMQDKLQLLIVKQDDELTILIRKLKLPEEFLSFLSFLESLKIDLYLIDAKYFEIINETFIEELSRIETNIPDALSNSNYVDQFKLYYLDEQQYRAGITILAASLLHLNNDQLKKLSSIFYRYKPLYFGGYEAKAIAINFTEFILLTLLSIENITGLEREYFKEYKELIQKFINNLFYPFVLEIEKEDYIWDPKNNEITKHNFSKYLINISLKDMSLKIYKYDLWDELFKKLTDYKTAQWPFQREGFNSRVK